TLSAEAIANTGITNQPVATAQPSRLMRFDQMSPTQLASTVQDYQVLSPYTTIYRDSAPGGFDFETLQDYQRQLIRGSDLESEPGQPLSSAIDGRVSERTDSPTSA